MPRLKIDDDELDADELDNAEYEDRQFESYSGETPPKDTVLRAYVKSIWWTYTQAEDPMLKLLVIADGNGGDEEEYDGCPFWENLPLTTKAKFKWAPFFQQFGLTMRAVKAKTMIAENDDNMGAPITKLGGVLVPGEEARCGIIVSHERYQGKVTPHIGEWLDDFEPDEDDEEEEEAPPPPRRKAAAASTKKTSAPKAAAARPSAKSRPAKTEEPEDEDEEELEDYPEEDEEEESPPTPPRRTAKTASGPAKRPAPSKPSASKAAGRTSAARKGKASDYDDDPPF